MQQRVYSVDQAPSFLARWTSRLPLFSAVLLIVTAFLHRVFSLPTPVALNISAAVFAVAALVLVMAAVAGLDIWMTGRQGASRIVFGTSIALALLAIPAALYIASRQWPEINDVTTDVVTPPEFIGAAQRRAAGSNPSLYPADRFAGKQREYYPDIKTLVVPRSTEEAFESALQALAKLRYKTSFEAPPEEDPGSPGIIEVSDRTMILGFPDDVVIRVTGDEVSSRIDVRSASRYGRNDFGRNAERIRELLQEIVGRLEASVAAPRAQKKPVAKKDDKPGIKRQKGRDPESADGRRRQDPSRSDTRRGLVRKALPRPSDADQAPGKQRVQSGE